LTHRRARFALTPWAIATAAIDTPGELQAATTRALNSALCSRRRRRPSTISFVVVSTCPSRSWWTRGSYRIRLASRCRAETLTVHGSCERQYPANPGSAPFLAHSTVVAISQLCTQRGSRFVQMWRRDSRIAQIHLYEANVRPSISPGAARPRLRNSSPRAWPSSIFRSVGSALARSLIIFARSVNFNTESTSRHE
jgi:hypothetical protein